MEYSNEEPSSALLPRRISSEEMQKLHSYYVKSLSAEALDYLKRRGIEEKTAERFQMGFESAKIGFYTPRGNLSGYFTNCIVIPVKDATGQIVDLIGRSIYDEKPKYKTLVGRSEIFFNEQVIQDSEDIILCKNIFDVLSLDQADLPTICVSDMSPFKEIHAQKLAGKRVFICYPNDEAGRRESNRISAMLADQAKEIYIVYLPEGFRDINHFFVQVKNPVDSFHDLLNETVEQSLKIPVSPDARNLVVFLEEYMKRFNGDVKGVSTGFAELDKKLLGGFRCGFYLITGLVSSGKSMLLRQMADFIASQGTPVVYVSWDMTAYELWARSMARMLKVPPQLVIAGKVPLETLNQVNQEYAQTAKNLWTLEGTMDTTMDQVEDYIERIIQSIGRVPVVFIDHFYRIPLRDKEGRLIQQNFPLVSYFLHQWSRQWDTPIVVAAPEPSSEQQLSPTVEAAVDVIMSLATEEMGQTADERENISLHVKKNRNGTLGKISLIFDKERAVFHPSQA